MYLDFRDYLGGDDRLGEHVSEVGSDGGGVDTLHITSGELRKSAEGLDVALVSFDRDYVDSHALALGELSDSLIELIAFSLFLFGFGFIVSA